MHGKRDLQKLVCLSVCLQSRRGLCQEESCRRSRCRSSESFQCQPVMACVCGGWGGGGESARACPRPRAHRICCRERRYRALNMRKEIKRNTDSCRFLDVDELVHRCIQVLPACRSYVIQTPALLMSQSLEMCCIEEAPRPVLKHHPL